MSLEPETLATWHWLATQPAEAMMNPRDLDDRLARLRQVFVVLAQPALTPQPRQRPLHHPTASQGYEPALAGRAADHPQLIRPVMDPQPALQFVVVVLVVRLDHFQAREGGPRHLREDLLGR